MTRVAYRAVVVMGVAGSGKTTFGEALANALRWPFIEGDAHHAPAAIAKMQAGQPLTDEDRWGWLDRLGSVLASQAPAVLSCSALKRVYRDRLRAACPGLAFIHLEIDEALALQRVSARVTRHMFPAGLVDSQFQTLEPPRGEDGVSTLSASLPLGEQVQQALRVLTDEK